MCGIVGIVARNEVKQDIYDALTILQHRGQDAAGMVTSDGRHCYLRKDNGLVKDVFQGQHMQRLQGNVGIGQCRYPTAGSASSADSSRSSGNGMSHTVPFFLYSFQPLPVM